MTSRLWLPSRHCKLDRTVIEHSMIFFESEQPLRHFKNKMLGMGVHVISNRCPSFGPTCHLPSPPVDSRNFMNFFMRSRGTLLTFYRCHHEEKRHGSRKWERGTASSSVMRRGTRFTPLSSLVDPKAKLSFSLRLFWVVSSSSSSDYIILFYCFSSSHPSFPYSKSIKFLPELRHIHLFTGTLQHFCIVKNRPPNQADSRQP